MSIKCQYELSGIKVIVLEEKRIKFYLYQKEITLRLGIFYTENLRSSELKF